MFLYDLIQAHFSFNTPIHNLESELRMTASILKDYPERAFPHVLIYSTLLAVLSIAVVGIISFNVAF